MMHQQNSAHPNPSPRNMTAAACLALTLLLGPGVAWAECERTGSGGEVVGTMLGAAIGGLIGSQIGSGSGNKVAIGAGVLAGGLLGNKVGRSMDCRDIEYHNGTAQSSFETQRTGTTSEWVNPDSGHSGSVTPVQTYQRSDGVYCRDFEQTITVDGETELAGGTACRQPDGTWQIVSA